MPDKISPEVLAQRSFMTNIQSLNINDIVNRLYCRFDLFFFNINLIILLELEMLLSVSMRNCLRSSSLNYIVFILVFIL